MGLDLEVLPVSYDILNWWLAHNRMKFMRDYGLFDEIRDLQSYPLPMGKEVEYYFDDGISKTSTDAYGNELRVIYAKEFKKLILNDMDLSSGGQWNLSILMMLQNLPEDVPVILFWC